MKRNEIGSSSNNPECHREGQSGSSSSRGRDITKQMSNLSLIREAQAVGGSKEQQDREQVQQKGKEKETTYQDLSPELLLKLWAQKLVKNLHDVEAYSNYHDRNAAIELIAKEADKSLAPEIVKQLTGCSSDFKLEILSVIKRWGNQLAVPELVDMLKDDHYESPPLLDYKMYGAIAGLIGKLGGLSKVQEVLDNGSLNVDTWKSEAMKMVKTTLESPSGGSKLVEKLSNESDPLYTGRYACEYKELTYGVLRMLGDMSIAKKLSESFKTSKGFKLIGEICKISDDPKEIKVLADKSINLIRDGVYLEDHDMMFKVVGGLGKRLVQLKANTEAEMLSKTLVAMFFNERVGKMFMPFPAGTIDPVPDHFNAVFTIEQHLAVQDPMMRLLYREAMDKKVCEAIAEKVVDYRKELVGSEDVEKFYGKLFEIFSHSDIEEKVRLKMIFSIADRIGEVENKPFMPELLKRLSPALLSKDWSSKAYEIYKLSKNSSAKDIGELFEELIEKHPDEQISPNVQKAIVRLASLVGTRLSLALKLAEKLSDEQFKEVSDRQFNSEIRLEVVDACRKLGQKLVNQGEDIKELTEKLCDGLSKERDQKVRAKLISAIEEFGNESTVLKLARMLRLSREIYEDAQEEFQEEFQEEAHESAATLRGGDQLVHAQIFGGNQQIRQIEQISSKNNVHNTSSDIKENEYEEIEDDVRQEMGKLSIRLLVHDAEKRSQELQRHKPATDVETGVIDSSQR